MNCFVQASERLLGCGVKDVTFCTENRNPAVSTLAATLSIVQDYEMILHKKFSFDDCSRFACKPVSPLGVSKMSASLHDYCELTTRTADIWRRLRQW